MTYILFSSFVALLALAIAIVPVTVILMAERRSAKGSPALAGRIEPSAPGWPIAA